MEGFGMWLFSWRNYISPSTSMRCEKATFFLTGKRCSGRQDNFLTPEELCLRTVSIGFAVVEFGSLQWISSPSESPLSCTVFNLTTSLWHWMKSPKLIQPEAHGIEQIICLFLMCFLSQPKYSIEMTLKVSIWKRKIKKSRDLPYLKMYL